MQTPDPTLHGFVLNLLSDSAASEAFDLDPVHALTAAGLPDVTPQDVLDAVPLVMDFTSSGPEGVHFGGHTWGDLSEAGGRFHAHAGPLGSMSGKAEVSTDGVASHGNFDSALGSGEWSFHGGLDVFHGRFDLSGLDADSIGKGGDLVTGTVAGFVTDGASTFTGMLTEGAASLAGHTTGGADTTGGLITDGAGMVSDTLSDPTSALTNLPAGVPDVTHGLPLDLNLPAVPAAPALPQLPDAGHLPLGLPDLPVDLPQLPVSLPSLPDLTSGLPAAPSLPSLPGVDTVHDTVAGVTSHVPLVGDLTNGLTDHLPLDH